MNDPRTNMAESMTMQDLDAAIVDSWINGTMAASLVQLRDRGPIVVTGGAGFIGSWLTMTLLRGGCDVIVIDNLSTGSMSRVERCRTYAERLQSMGGSARFRFEKADIRDGGTMAELIGDSQVLFHQAALGSVPRSVKDPLSSFSSNAEGTQMLLEAARKVGVERIVYASSSSVYGDNPKLPKTEADTGRPLSPYAATKVMKEAIASAYRHAYGMSIIGLRYFNVFGPDQSIGGPYAAVIPAWIDAAINGNPAWVNGDGQTSRDFCYIANAVQANLLAATADRNALPDVVNVTHGHAITLLDLAQMMNRVLVSMNAEIDGMPILIITKHREERVGDIRHSLADISLARSTINYHPDWHLAEGMVQTIEWFIANERQMRQLPHLPVPARSKDRNNACAV